MCIVCHRGRSPSVVSTLVVKSDAPPSVVADAPPTLEENKRATLDISYCRKVTEIQIPESLQVLYCVGCTNLMSLGPLPESLRELYCSGCTNLISLGPLPESLRRLSCSGCTNLTSLGPLPEGLQKLFCNGCTNLTSLGPLPESLRELYCGGCTNLTSLGPLPKGLRVLHCYGCTNLTSLEPLPESLLELYCNGCRVLTQVGPQSVIDNLHDYRPSTWTPSGQLENNLRKLVIVQNFYRTHRTRKLLRLSRTREFCEWFYHPENYGGRWAKASLRKMVEGTSGVSMTDREIC